MNLLVGCSVYNMLLPTPDLQISCKLLLWRFLPDLGNEAHTSARREIWEQRRIQTVIGVLQKSVAPIAS